MKKHHFKNYIKLSILLFGVIAFFTNCEKENINTSNPSTVISSSPSFTLKRIDNPPISENKHSQIKLNQSFVNLFPLIQIYS